MNSVFLSAVTSEFGDLRRDLAARLNTPGNVVRVQHDFITGDATLLEKLADYIRGTDVVIQLVGCRAGSSPTDAEARTLLQRFPGLARFVQSEIWQPSGTGARYSYTQWEGILAVFLNKPFLVYVIGDVLQTLSTDEEHPAFSQQHYLSALQSLGKDHCSLTQTSDAVLTVLRDLPVLQRRLDHVRSRRRVVRSIMGTGIVAGAGLAGIIVPRMGPFTQDGFLRDCEAGPPPSMTDLALPADSPLLWIRDSKFQLVETVDRGGTAPADFLYRGHAGPEALTWIQSHAERDDVPAAADSGTVTDVKLPGTNRQLNVINTTHECLYIYLIQHAVGKCLRFGLKGGQQTRYPFLRPDWYRAVVRRFHGDTLDLGWIFIPPLLTGRLLIQESNQRLSVSVLGIDTPL